LDEEGFKCKEAGVVLRGLLKSLGWPFFQIAATRGQGREDGSEHGLDVLAQVFGENRS